MPFEDCQKFYAPCNKNLMVSILEEEDKDFGQEGANTPDDDLNQPGSNVDKLVWIDLIVIKRHVFVRVDSTF